MFEGQEAGKEAVGEGLDTGGVVLCRRRGLVSIMEGC